jgi:hypothetical protein
MFLSTIYYAARTLVRQGFNHLKINALWLGFEP